MMPNFWVHCHMDEEIYKCSPEQVLLRHVLPLSNTFTDKTHNLEFIDRFVDIFINVENKPKVNIKTWLAILRYRLLTQVSYIGDYGHFYYKLNKPQRAIDAVSASIAVVGGDSDFCEEYIEEYKNDDYESPILVPVSTLEEISNIVKSVPCTDLTGDLTGEIKLYNEQKPGKRYKFLCRGRRNILKRPNS